MMRKNFPTDEDLKSRCIQLYETIVQAIGTLIIFLLPETKDDNHHTDRNAARGFLRFRGRISSTEQIDEAVGTVKGEADELNRLTEQLWERLFVKLDKNVATLVQQGLENEEWSKEFERKQEILGGKQDTLGRKQDTLLQKQDILEDNQDELKRDLGFIKTQAIENHKMMKGVVQRNQERDGLAVMNYFISLLEQREEQSLREGFRSGLEYGASPPSLYFYV